MRNWILAGTLLAAVAACGVPEEKYKAVVDEHDRALKSAKDEAERADAAERQNAELKARIAELGKANAATAAEAEAQRRSAGELEKTKEALEAEKRALEKRSSDYQSLATSLDKEIKAGRVQVSELEGKLTVRMAEKVLFPTGSATISREGQATLKAVAEGLQAVSGRIIRVEGHTDNVPIHNDRFASNWELSSARAIAVVRFLQKQGIDPTRLGAAGYAEYQPIAPNETAEGRAQNRRIEISLALPPNALPTQEKGTAK